MTMADDGHSHLGGFLRVGGVFLHQTGFRNAPARSEWLARAETLGSSNPNITVAGQCTKQATSLPQASDGV
jgi:hypothetical protein